MSHTRSIVLRPRASASWFARTWSSLRQRLERRSYWRHGDLRDPAYASLFGSAPTYSGIRVTERNAFTFSAVFDAVQQISADVAKLPLVLRKRRSSGRGSDEYDASPLYWLLKMEPNDETGSMVFRRTLTAHALTCHGGYAEIERDAADRPVALWIITPDRIEPHRDERRTTTGEMAYGPLRYKVDGGARFLEPHNVIHLQGLGYDGTQGYSVIHAARQAIGLALSAERFGATFFGVGAMFGGVLAMEGDIDETQAEDIRRRVEKIHEKPEQAAWRFLVLGGDAKYQPFGLKPSESQMNELRDRQVIEVARFFNMPPHKLKALDRATFSNIESQDLDYYKSCLLTWITLWEEELNRKLVPRLERRQQFIKHNVKAFLRGDIQSRYTALGIARDKGVINANEWRDLEDMNPQDGDQGDLYLVQSAQIPLARLDQFTLAIIAKNEGSATPIQPPSGTAQARAALERARDAFERGLDELRERTARAESLAAAETAAREAERVARVEAEAAGLLNEQARAEAETRARDSAGRLAEYKVWRPAYGPNWPAHSRHGPRHRHGPNRPPGVWQSVSRRWRMLAWRSLTRTRGLWRCWRQNWPREKP